MMVRWLFVLAVFLLAASPAAIAAASDPEPEPVSQAQLERDGATLQATVGSVLSWSNSQKAIATGMVQELTATAKDDAARTRADFVILAVGQMFSEQGSLMSIMSIDDLKAVWTALQHLPAEIATLDHVSTASTAAVTMYNQQGGSPGEIFADFVKQPDDSSNLKLYGTTDHFTWTTPAYWETDESDDSGDGSGSSSDSSGDSSEPEVVHQVHASGPITGSSPVGGVTNGSWSITYDALQDSGSVSVSGTIDGQSGGYSFSSCGGGSASTGSVSFAVCGTRTFGKVSVDISGYASASAGGGFSLHIDGRAGSQTASASVSGETDVFIFR